MQTLNLLTDHKNKTIDALAVSIIVLQTDNMGS